MAISNIDVYSQAGSFPTSARSATPVSALPGTKELVQQQAQSATSQVSKAEVDTAVKQINEFISPILQSIQFSTDNDSGRVVVKVVDSETQKVLRQIPNEEVLAISKTLDKLQGLIIRQTA
ncbi:flagellar protein FlaG [Methylobacillus glycogenes]|uniref:flagellar protein FlaG n=1 Tax=Methylobacillus glycogenes TaxID=406 RepID=UPI00047202EA|nr:flagellar protein FlaG [Methylobacillus glycogenes]